MFSAGREQDEKKEIEYLIVQKDSVFVEVDIIKDKFEVYVVYWTWTNFMKNSIFIFENLNEKFRAEYLIKKEVYEELFLVLRDSWKEPQFNYWAKKHFVLVKIL